MSSDAQKIGRSECPVCFRENLPSSSIVYSSCCFQKVCAICDQMLNKCAHCRAELGDLRIRFGDIRYDQKNSSILRLLPNHNTVSSVISVVKRYFPLLETQLTNRLTMFCRYSGRWYCIHNDKIAINVDGEHYLQNMRLPHIELTDSEVDGWIVALLTSGNHLTTKPLTKEEIHQKCKSYATRIHPSPLTQDYVNSRIENLAERGYCKLNEETGVYHYLP